MEDFTFPDPPDPKDLPWWKRIPTMYYWWLASIFLLAIAFIWLPSQCSIDALNFPQRGQSELDGLEAESPKRSPKIKNELLDMSHI